MGNILLGFIGLALLEGIVSRKGAAARVGGYLEGAGKAVEWFLSPTVPAFASASSTTSSTALAVETAASGAGSAAPAAAAAPPPPALSPTFPGESLQTIAQGGAV